MRRIFTVTLAVWLVSASLLALAFQPLLAQDGVILGEAPYLADGAIVTAAGDDIVVAAAVPGVDTSSRAATANFFFSYYTAEPAIDWTGSHASCNAGTTSTGFKNAVIDRIAFYRAMAGIPSSIGLSATSSAGDQQAALMFSRNGQLSHSPASNWTCYTASGAQAAANSNIALGAHGTYAIDAYMRDPGPGNTAAGHRRWLLFPQTQSFGTGDIPPTGNYSAANAVWAWDSNVNGPRPATRDNFVAWPPSGYVPYQVVFARWSFSYPGANFGSASVTITSDGVNIPVSIDSTTANGYGENTIVFRPNGWGDGTIWPNPGTDKTYTVKISGVVAGGQNQTFTYNVTVFDPSSAAPQTTPTTTPTRTNTPTRTPTSGPVTTTSTPTTIPGGQTPGDLVRITNNLNIRIGPGTSYNSIAILPSGTIAEVIGHPVFANGYTWYEIIADGYGSGWAAGEYFAMVTPTPSPTSTMTPSSTPTATTTPTPAPPTTTPTPVPPTATPTRTWTPGPATSTPTSPPATATPTRSPDGFLPDDVVRTTVTVNFRTGPGTGYSVILGVPSNTLGTITGSPVAANGYTWYPLTFDGIGDGWIASNYLSLVSTPTPVILTATPTHTVPAGPSTNTPTSGPATATRIPGGFLFGDIVRTTATVNFRTGPSTSYSVITGIPSNTLATVIGSPVIAENYTWYPLFINGAGTGWIASNYLAAVTIANPDPTETPTPLGGLAIGSTVYLTANLNIRSGPGTSYSSYGVAPKGTDAIILNAPEKVGSVYWFPLNVTGIGTGWASGSYLSPSPTVMGPLYPGVLDPSDEQPATVVATATTTVVDTITATATPTTVETSSLELGDAPMPGGIVVPAADDPEPLDTSADSGDTDEATTTSETDSGITATTGVPPSDSIMESDPAEADEPVAEAEPAAVAEAASSDESATGSEVNWLPIERVQRSADSQPGQLLVDDDLTTTWFANGTGQPLAMFVLDLGQEVSFSQISWHHGDAGVFGTLYLAISSNGEDWIELDPTLVTVNEAGWQVLDTTTSGHYIRFVFINDTGEDVLGGIDEVRIMP